MELKPGYKQTEVGVIPEDWEVVTASEACSLVVDCKNRTPPIVDASEYAVVRTPNVRDGHFIQEDLRFTDESSYREWTTRAVPQAGDIMITREAPLGEVCAVPETHKVCLGQRMMIYRPSPSKTDSRYLLYSLMSLPVRANLMRKIGGSTVGHAKVDDIRFLKLPLPPLSEQRTIATLLSDTDALLASLKQLIAEKRDIKQAAMQELLTGKRRLPGFEGEWVAGKLGDYVEKIVGGGTPSRANPGFWGGEIPWATVKDLTSFQPNQTQEWLTRDGLKNSSANLIPAGTLIASTRMALGKAVIFGTDIAINQDLKAIFFGKNGMARFFCYWFEANASAIDAIGGGSTVKGISLSQLKAFDVASPGLVEQNAIVDVIFDIETEIETLENRLTKTRAIKQAMMQELLTGRIRLR
jgi:type I restriction enzyme, S subunit